MGLNERTKHLKQLIKMNFLNILVSSVGNEIVNIDDVSSQPLNPLTLSISIKLVHF